MRWSRGRFAPNQSGLRKEHNHIAQIPDPEPQKDDGKTFSGPYLFSESNLQQGLNVRSTTDFTNIYQTLYPYAFFHARSFVSPEEASDIVAAVFLKIWSLPNPRFANMNHVKGFLKTCIRNACLTQIRREKKRGQVTATWNALSEEPFVENESVHGSFQFNVHAEKMQRVHDAIEKLPEKSRRVFKMSYIDRMKVSEIADALGVSENTVRSQKQDSLKKLRMMLKALIFIFLGAF